MALRDRLPNDLLPWCFGVCAVATLFLLWSVSVLPMADLPQHESGLAVWKRMTPGSPESGLYELDLFTPYVLPHLIATGLSLVLSVHEAFRCVVALACLGLPAALWVFLRRTGGDPWWCLCGFPFSFGVAFFWGLLPWLLAIPLGVLMLSATFALLDAPSRRGAVWLLALTALTLACHAIAWGLFGLACVGVVLAHRPTPWPRRLQILGLMAATAPALAVWVVRMAGAPAEEAETIWDVRVFRVVWLYVSLLGRDPLALPAFAALLLGIGASARGLRPDRGRRGLALFGLAVFLLFPLQVHGSPILYPRLGVFTLICVLPLLAPAEPSPRRGRARALLVIAVLAWTAVLGVRFADFDRELGRFRAVTRDVPTRAKVLSLVQGTHEPLYGRPFVHVAQLLVLDAPRRVEFSLTHYKVMPVHRVDAHGQRAAYFTSPEEVRDALERSLFDYVITGQWEEPLARYPQLSEWTRVSREGSWQLFRAPAR